jgi:hypothetical protein
LSKHTTPTPPPTPFITHCQLDIGALEGSGSAAAQLAAAQLAGVKQRVLSVLLHPRHVQLRDKLSFMIGSCQVW